LNSVPGRVGEVVTEKVHSTLSMNPGYEQICESEEILAGERTELPSKRITKSGANSDFCTCALRFL
jgi:hypothetical protein